MSKRLLSILICSSLLVYSCKNIKINSESIIGNWQIHPQHNKKAYYQEIYFDGANSFYYDFNLELRPRRKYKLRDNNFYEMNLNESEYKFIGEIRIIDDTLKIYNSDFNYNISFIKIKEPNNIQSYLSDKITNEEMWESFYFRYQEWNK